MAKSSVLERHESDGRIYEVVRAGRLVCLYTNGVLHTAFDEEQLISGRVWDLLALPGIVTEARRALVLGVAGGAALRQLLAFGRVERIDGVDLDGVNLDLGRRHFGLDDPRIRLHHADARDFVRKSRAKYDLILDDVFIDEGGEPERAIAFDSEWSSQLAAHLADDGVLVVNNASEREARSGALDEPRFLASFASVLSMTTSTASNVVFTLFRAAMSERALRMKAKTALGASAERLDLRVRTRAQR